MFSASTSSLPSVPTDDGESVAFAASNISSTISDIGDVDSVDVGDNDVADVGDDELAIVGARLALGVGIMVGTMDGVSVGIALMDGGAELKYSSANAKSYLAAVLTA